MSIGADEEKMKILMITPDYYPHSYGGIGVCAYHLAKELEKCKQEVTVLYIRTDRFISTTYDINAEKGMTVISFIPEDCTDSKINYKGYRFLFNSLRAINSLRNFFDNHSFDIIHIHDYYNCMVAAICLEHIKFHM